MRVYRPDEIAELAHKAQALGAVFTAEKLMTGAVSIACEYELDPEEGTTDIAIKVCPNGPPVLEAVDEVIRKSYELIIQGE